MEVGRRIIGELVELKEDCYVNGNLDRERVDKYNRTVELYQSKGLKCQDIGVHALVVEIFYEKLNGINKKKGLNGILQKISRRSA